MVNFVLNFISPIFYKVLYMSIIGIFVGVFILFIRKILDKRISPISKHINTAIQADVTYILMKPLEWIFLLVLYMFDEKPENRIATQYIGK